MHLIPRPAASTQRLVKEAENRGVEVEIVDPLETSLVLVNEMGKLFTEDGRLKLMP